MSNLRALLLDATEAYIDDKKNNPFTGSKSGDLFRNEIPEELRSIIGPSAIRYKVEGSIGRGNYAEIPWVCIFDKRITESASKGIYLVQLNTADGSGIYFVLGQGTTYFQNNYGGAKSGREKAREFVSLLRKKLNIPDRYDLNKHGEVRLKGKGDLGLGYEAGSVAGIYYNISDMPAEETLVNDLSEMLKLYEQVSNLIGDQRSYEQFVEYLLAIESDATYPDNKNSDIGVLVIGDEETNANSKAIARKHALNKIIYGAPGTGKTYSLIEYAVSIVEDREINRNRLTTEERAELMRTYNEYVDDKQIVFTTFHQSYGYEEFVQGIRPVIDDGAIAFELKDGILKKITDRAIRNKEKNYVLIIDEINRGNISKIFGELITLIEEDKRWGEINQLSTKLPSAKEGEDDFRVPNNLYIIGTMNSADKSISLIDAALRRRFVFEEMIPDPNLIDNMELRELFGKLNIHLRQELRGTDLLIGHSYFMDKTLEDLADIMNNNIIPLLYEYFYDDEDKIVSAIKACLSDTHEIDPDYQGRKRIRRK